MRKKRKNPFATDDGPIDMFVGTLMADGTTRRMKYTNVETKPQSPPPLFRFNVSQAALDADFA